MDDLKTKTANLASHVEELVQTYYDLARINVAQGASKAVARTIIFLLLAWLLLCVLLLAGIGLSFYVGKLVHNTAAGFFIVAGIYLFVVVILFLLLKKMVFPFIRNAIVQRIYDKRDKDL
jgi:ABC-type siderophore export system fused ATPase/permease subunit